MMKNRRREESSKIETDRRREKQKEKAKTDEIIKSRIANFTVRF